MHHHARHVRAASAARGEQIAALHRAHARALERRVACRARADPHTIEDACSFAWAQLLAHPAIDIATPWNALAWLAQTAVREAWRLEARRARDGLRNGAEIDDDPQLCAVDPGPDELAVLRARRDLVGQIPQRPRRFLLRLALGYSYREIATDEGVSLTTTNKQIARAKRLLRALDADDGCSQSAEGVAALAAGETSCRAIAA